MNGYLLDTNVLSETVKPRPAASVLEWLARQSPVELFLASITIGELVQGVRRRAEAPRARRLERWIHTELTLQFEGRVVSFDRRAAVIWGELMGDGYRIGRPPPAVDAQLAAIARQHSLVLVTRNVRDFQDLGVQLVDPWSPEPAPPA